MSWSSSDETVVTISDGHIKALRHGSATLTASIEDGATATCTVTVSGTPQMLRLPSGITVIDEDAFAGMNSIKAVLLPDGVESIESGAFADCANLLIINIPDSVTTIAQNAFDGCGKLRIYCAENSPAVAVAAQNGIDCELIDQLQQ